ncbi:VWA domain-containing protein [Streptomyces sp. A7024]|uniref:VWA domain-containing protein n=1 Tax=Streptomyces coryli TaxID=1128680 RepID=A0A6G4U9F2_9ACTN|nr:VWA domain-containing protein [Streptomyces coryli]NGN68008.1 VWA domain-containing protein [Streptomyces coryli]
MTTPDMAFASGYDERQPVLVLLDTSESMGRPQESPRIDALNQRLGAWFEGVRAQARLRARIEVCLIAFATQVDVYHPKLQRLVPAGERPTDEFFAPVGELTPPRLEAGGYTCMAAALRTALDLARERHEALRARRVPVRRPFIWMLTDGAPSDELGYEQSAADLAPLAARLRAAEQAGECVLQAIGVAGADRELLEVLAPKGTAMLADLDFGQILDHLFTSSDRVDPAATADETHAEIARQAELRRRLTAMEEGLR